MLWMNGWMNEFWLMMIDNFWKWQVTMENWRIVPIPLLNPRDCFILKKYSVIDWTIFRWGMCLTGSNFLLKCSVPCFNFYIVFNVPNFLSFAHLLSSLFSGLNFLERCWDSMEWKMNFRSQKCVLHWTPSVAEKLAKTLS